jgi:hypothetical protein
MVHGTCLPNRDCNHCGTEFYSRHEKKYCSEKCRENGVTRTGSNNPTKQGGKTTTTCEICGTTFEYYPCAKRGLYCSDCVETENWRHDPDIDGENNPRWNGGKRTVACEVCGTTEERWPADCNDVTVCSEACRREWLSESFTGDGHPNWNGGGNADYGKGWRRVRKRALERDGHQCRLCGVTKADLGRNPDVHHIIPVRWFSESSEYTREDAHFLANVISLCISCHRKAEFGHVSRSRLCSLASTAGETVT